jgi:hypothetical protein
VAVQTHVMQKTYRIADKCIFPVPLNNVSWLPGNPVRAAVIPIGGNLPVSELRAQAPSGPKTKMRVRSKR